MVNITIDLFINLNNENQVPKLIAHLYLLLVEYHITIILSSLFTKFRMFVVDSLWPSCENYLSAGLASFELFQFSLFVLAILTHGHRGIASWFHYTSQTLDTFTLVGRLERWLVMYNLSNPFELSSLSQLSILLFLSLPVHQAPSHC